MAAQMAALRAGDGAARTASARRLRARSSAPALAAARAASRRRAFGVGVLGIGVLGGAVAQALGGARLSGARPCAHARKTIAGVDCYAGAAGFDAFLDRPRRPGRRAAADAGHARHARSRARCALLADGAHVVNVGARRARRRRRSARAARPGQARRRDARRVRRRSRCRPTHPFWHHPRHHASRRTCRGTTLPDESVAQIAAKIRALERGVPVTGVVDRDARLLTMHSCPHTGPPRRRRSARRPAEREGDGADRGQGRADRPADRRRLAGDRGDVVRVAEVGAADGRRRRRDGAHPRASPACAIRC